MTASLSYLRMRIENGGTVRGINAKGQGGMPRKKIDKLVAFAKDYGAKGLGIYCNSGRWYSQVFICQIYDRGADESPDRCNGRREQETCFSLQLIRIKWYGQYSGALRLELAAQMDLLDKNEYQIPVGNRVPTA